MKNVVVLLADGFEDIEAITAIDFLRRGGITTVVAGVTEIEITSSHNVCIKTDATIGSLEAKNFDGVVIPGGIPGADNLAASVAVKNLVMHMMEEKRLIAAICAAPVRVLGAYGLLSGRRFTCYPGFEKEIQSGMYIDKDVVIDDNIITSKGVGTAATFSIEVIKYLMGDAASAAVAKATLLS
jgi:4-methyl-5(b-hydroxyethyl)-thiazole monophosphate biosynthesis